MSLRPFRSPKSRSQNPPWPRWAELPAAQGARRRRSRRSATPTTSNAARRSKSAQPFGLRRQAAVSGVAPPRRIAADTPSSSLLGSGGLALATRLTRGFETGSKILLRVTAATLWLWAGLHFAVQPAWAADAVSPAAKIGVVDVDRVFKEYKATQTKESELEKFSTVKQAEREKKVSEIRNLRDELALLNEENRTRQRQAIEGKLRDLALFDQQTKDSLREQREQAVDGLLKEIEQVVTTFAKERGYDLILSNRAVLYGIETADLTNEVISVLNQKNGKSESR